MTQSPLSKLNVSKERFSQLQEALVAKGEEVSDQGARLRKQVEERSSVMAGRLRDASLERLFDTGASTLSTAAELLEKVAAAKPGVKSLRERAKAVESAKEAVHHPPIDDYDSLNVKEVNDALDELSVYELDKVRRWEKAHKNRVTVLRELDERLG